MYDSMYVLLVPVPSFFVVHAGMRHVGRSKQALYNIRILIAILVVEAILILLTEQMAISNELPPWTLGPLFESVIDKSQVEISLKNVLYELQRGWSCWEAVIIAVRLTGSLVYAAEEDICICETRPAFNGSSHQTSAISETR
jgi:hypothetical protein